MLHDDQERVQANLQRFFQAGKFKKIRKILEKNREYGLVRFENSRTVLHLALMHPNPVLLEFILATFPELISITDANGYNGFHYAVENFKNSDYLNILFEAPNALALIHQKNRNGVSALELASSSSNPQLLEIFTNFIFPTPAKVQDNQALAELSKRFSEINFNEKNNNSKQDRSKQKNKSDDRFPAVAHIQAAQAELDNLSKTIDATLLRAGFEAVNHSQEQLQTNPVWNLCGALSPFVLTQSQVKAGEAVFSSRDFSKDEFLNVLHGINSQMSTAEIVDNINKLWPEFDNTKKLTAIFIIKELILWDIDNHYFDKRNEINISINALMQQVELEFQPFGHTLTMLISNMLKTKKNISINQNCRDFKEARDKTQRANSVKMLESFDELLVRTSAISKEREQRENITRIANELSSVMLAFYHNVDISEFYNAAWSDEAKTSSPHIKRHIRIVNRLVPYLETFILNAESKEECASRISLLIRVASHLCESSDGVGPDLGSIAVIDQVLGSFAISRLKPCFALLSAQDTQRLQDIKNLAAPLNGYKLLKEVAELTRLPILNPGLLQQQVRLAYESPCAHHEVLGKVLRKILQQKRDLQTKTFKYETNMLHHLATGDYVSDSDAAELLAGRFVPLVLDYMPFEQAEKLVQLIIEGSIAPTISYEQKSFNKEEIIEPFLKKFSKCVGFADDIDEAENILTRSRILAWNLIEFCNIKYNCQISHLYQIGKFLAEPSPNQSKTFRKKRSMSLKSSIELEGSPVYIVSPPPELTRKYSTEKMGSPKRTRKRIPI